MIEAIGDVDDVPRDALELDVNVAVLLVGHLGLDLPQHRHAVLLQQVLLEEEAQLAQVVEELPVDLHGGLLVFALGVGARPVVHDLQGAVEKVGELQVLQLPLVRLEAIVGDVDDGGVLLRQLVRQEEGRLDVLHQVPGHVLDRLVDALDVVELPSAALDAHLRPLADVVQLLAIPLGELLAQYLPDDGVLEVVVLLYQQLLRLRRHLEGPLLGELRRQVQQLLDHVKGSILVQNVADDQLLVDVPQSRVLLLADVLGRILG